MFIYYPLPAKAFILIAVVLNLSCTSARYKKKSINIKDFVFFLKIKYYYRMEMPIGILVQYNIIHY